MNEMDKRYEQFGTELFGPFLYGFACWLKDALSERKISKVFFLARDGYMMKSAFDILASGADMESRYIYASRNSLRLSLLWQCSDYEDSLRYLSRARYIQFQDIMEYYGFSSEESDRIGCESGLSADHDFEFSKLPQESVLKDIYTRCRSVICERSRKNFENVTAYFRQSGMTGRFALVDIGWHGSMQYYISEIMSLAGMKAEISGFYVGTLTRPEFQIETRGFLYDSADPGLRKSVLCSFGILEKLFQSLEGSAKDYIVKNGQVVPELKPYEYADDPAMQRHIRAWQSGALDYVVRHRDTSGKCRLEYVRMAMPLIQFGKTPDLRRLALFRSFYNTDGTRVYYLPQKGIFRYKPGEFAHALSNSPWKTGFMRAAFRLPLPYHLIYDWLKK